MDSAVEITKSSTVDKTTKEKSLSDFGFKKKSKKNKKSKNNNVSYMMKSDNLSTVDKVIKDEMGDGGGHNTNCLHKNSEQLKERLHNAQKPNGILMNGACNHFSEEYQCHSLNNICADELSNVNLVVNDDDIEDNDINSINSLSKKCANKLPEYLQCGYVPDKYHNHLSMDVTSEFIKNNTEDLGNPIATASTLTTNTMATHSNGGDETDKNILKMTNNNNNNLFSNNNNNSILYHRNDLVTNLCTNDLVDLKQKIDLLAENTGKLTINNENIVDLIDKKNILCKYPEHTMAPDDDDDDDDEGLMDINKPSVVDTNTKIIHQVISNNNNNSNKTGDSKTSTNNYDNNDATTSNDIEIIYKEYESELQMPDIIRLIQKDLSEPYSIYTYRYFIHNWPKLCFLAMYNDLCVGAIVCKLDLHHSSVKRGYIAMLAVDKTYRKMKIGTNLVQKAIQAMVLDNADEVVLETEITNTPALRLYENLGFVRDKRLFHYYLNGVDALRLKLWFR